MEDNTKDIIATKSLTKKFGSFTAVDHISFSVHKGEIFAFLGPNGAGKTTTIKMLITLLVPTSGDAVVDRYNLIKDAAQIRRVIGYVPQAVSVDGTLTAYENLMLMARLYDIPSKILKDKIREMLSFLSLEKEANSLVRTFSGGMVRKLEIGQAMLHNPPILFLDEPTTGLDPVAKKNIWIHLLELNKKYGTTIFFSTHNLDEAEEVSSRVAIMDQGKIAALGSVIDLKDKTGIRDATLEDVFIFFTGSKIQEKGNIRDIAKTRQIERRRG